MRTVVPVPVRTASATRSITGPGWVRTAAVGVATAGAVGVAALTGAGAASAHVTANAPTLTQGGYGVVTLVVPNESETAATTSLRVTLPKLKSARPEVLPGWRAEVTKDPATEEVTAITWTALPGSPGVAVGQFGQFRVSGGPFPKEESVALPAVQTYADGEKADWSQPEEVNGSEPEHPAPTLTLPADTGGGHHGGSAGAGSEHTDAASDESAGATDGTARWLGGIGLVLGALGAVGGAAALARGRRSGSGDA